MDVHLFIHLFSSHSHLFGQDEAVVVFRLTLLDLLLPGIRDTTGEGEEEREEDVDEEEASDSDDTTEASDEILTLCLSTAPIVPSCWGW